jgi:hypothetical protein
MADGFSDERFQRRLPSVERKISEIRPEDVRVKVLGTVIDKNGSRLVMDDGTGRIEVVFDEHVDVKLNQLVRVFGRVIPLEDGFEIQSEILQDMSLLDMDLLKKVEGINA